jgi:integrase/recombinase XerD
VLAIPPKRGEKRTVTFLTPDEAQALLDAPDRTTWAGRPDHALLLTAVQTGLRVSEVLGLTRADTQLGTGAHVRTIGKGRKERVAPLTSQTVAVLKVWMRETDIDPARPTSIRRVRCSPLATADRSPDAAQRRDRHLDDRTVAGPRTGAHDPRLPPRRPRTQQRTLDRITPPSGHPGRYRAPDSIIAFLDAL